MKYTLAFVILILFAACKKEASTVNSLPSTVNVQLATVAGTDTITIDSSLFRGVDSVRHSDVRWSMIYCDFHIKNDDTVYLRRLVYHVNRTSSGVFVKHVIQGIDRLTVKTLQPPVIAGDSLVIALPAQTAVTPEMALIDGVTGEHYHVCVLQVVSDGPNNESLSFTLVRAVFAHKRTSKTILPIKGLPQPGRKLVYRP